MTVEFKIAKDLPGVILARTGLASSSQTLICEVSKEMMAMYPERNIVDSNPFFANIEMKEVGMENIETVEMMKELFVKDLYPHCVENTFSFYKGEKSTQTLRQNEKYTIGFFERRLEEPLNHMIHVRDFEIENKEGFEDFRSSIEDSRYFGEILAEAKHEGMVCTNEELFRFIYYKLTTFSLMKYIQGTIKSIVSINSEKYKKLVFGFPVQVFANKNKDGKVMNNLYDTYQHLSGISLMISVIKTMFPGISKNKFFEKRSVLKMIDKFVSMISGEDSYNETNLTLDLLTPAMMKTKNMMFVIPRLFLGNGKLVEKHVKDFGGVIKVSQRMKKCMWFSKANYYGCRSFAVDIVRAEEHSDCVSMFLDIKDIFPPETNNMFSKTNENMDVWISRFKSIVDGIMLQFGIKAFYGKEEECKKKNWDKFVDDMEKSVVLDEEAMELLLKHPTSTKLVSTSYGHGFADENVAKKFREACMEVMRNLEGEFGSKAIEVLDISYDEESERFISEVSINMDVFENFDQKPKVVKRKPVSETTSYKKPFRKPARKFDGKQRPVRKSRKVEEIEKEIERSEEKKEEMKEEEKKIDVGASMTIQTDGSMTVSFGKDVDPNVMIEFLKMAKSLK